MQVGQHLGATIGADLDDEPVLVADELGEREIETAFGPRARSHRGAEARPARDAAVDGDEERLLAARRVVAVDVRALEEDPVLDRDRVEIAGADAEERKRPLGRRLLDELRPALVVPTRLPEAHARGQQPALPRVRADRIAEPRLVVAALEPVGGGVLHLRPPGGQLVRRRDLLVDDRAVPARRPDDAVAAITEHPDERVQAVEIDDGRRRDGSERGSSFTAGIAWILSHLGASVQAPSRCAGMPQSVGGIGRLRMRPRARQPGWVSETLAVERLRLRVRGVVQGVGFRPFVHRLAHRHGISGFVLNDADGVVVEAEGEPGALAAFVSAITAEAPPLARVAEHRRRRVRAPLRARVRDRRSARTDGRSRTTLIAPDAATCDDCLRELFDPADRRYRYPFINCTNCGPRFTIVTSVPYDRPRTTMAGFPLCAACRREYEDPGDRRFHAEPIACPDCGPRLTLPLEEAVGAPARQAGSSP